MSCWQHLCHLIQRFLHVYSGKDRRKPGFNCQAFFFYCDPPRGFDLENFPKLSSIVYEIWAEVGCNIIVTEHDKMETRTRRKSR